MLEVYTTYRKAEVPARGRVADALPTRPGAFQASRGWSSASRKTIDVPRLAASPSGHAGVPVK
jgi:hypothetical protein